MLDDLRTVIGDLGGAAEVLLVWLPAGLVVTGAVRVRSARRDGSSPYAVAVAIATLLLASISALAAISGVALHRDLSDAEFDDDIEAIFEGTPFGVLGVALAVSSLVAGTSLVTWASARSPRAVPRRARLVVGLTAVALVIGCVVAGLGLTAIDAEAFEHDYFDAQEILDRATVLAFLGSVMASTAAIAGLERGSAPRRRHQRPAGMAGTEHR